MHTVAMLLGAVAAAAAAGAAAGGGGTPQCTKTQAGVDYAFGDIKAVQARNSTGACCAACKATPGCLLWVLATDGGPLDCYLKKTWSVAPCVESGQPCRRSLPGRISMDPETDDDDDVSRVTVTVSPGVAASPSSHPTIPEAQRHVRGLRAAGATGEIVLDI